MALKPGQKFQGFRSTNDQPKKKLARYQYLSLCCNTIFIHFLLLIRAALGERIHLEEDVNKIKLAPSAGSREMTFTLPQVVAELLTL